ncbi:hypothetical protein ERW49_18700 [Aliivibrio finisterrensis]|uniref:Uncharacterized protein n=1 Tax=Aliivibrio finisterrensis TaxID=511998 RepID=A0A4V1Z6C2_9GAMM|nr:hypothetical protein [Aliivibrio finisterrensis]RYU41310.1 hypothetical protein ERW49_18700 [Aliivibrio finisterrensis]
MSIVELIIDAITENGPLARVDIQDLLKGKHSLTNSAIGSAIHKMKKANALKMIGNSNQRPLYDLTDTPCFSQCDQCNKHRPIWVMKKKSVSIGNGKSKQLDVCSVCRNEEVKKRTRKEKIPGVDNLFKEFDEATPFNKLLRLPFGLPSQRYAECL